jgi:hypothetical protein
MTSADLTELLRSSRPSAPDALRERVREIAAAKPVAAPFPRLRLPRLRLVVPAAAATALAAAALIAVVRPEHQQVRLDSVQTPSVTEATPPTATTQLQDGLDLASPQTVRKASTGQAQDHGASRAAAPSTDSGRAVDYQAQIGVEVRDNDALASATDRAQRVARDLGGYVVAVQYASAESGSASLTLRVPTAKVQDAIAQLTALGKITSQQVQIRDLQEQLDQLAAQIVSLHQRIAHITALLAAPDLTAERKAQLEARRAQLQATLASMRRQRAGTAQEAALATIQLTLATKQQSTGPAPASRARRTLDEAGRILTWEGVAVLYGLVVAGPFLVVGAAAWFAARMRRRSIESRLLARS